MKFWEVCTPNICFLLCFVRGNYVLLWGNSWVIAAATIFDCKHKSTSTQKNTKQHHEQKALDINMTGNLLSTKPVAPFFTIAVWGDCCCWFGSIKEPLCEILLAHRVLMYLIVLCFENFLKLLLFLLSMWVSTVSQHMPMRVQEGCGSE